MAVNSKLLKKKTMIHQVLRKKRMDKRYIVYFKVGADRQKIIFQGREMSFSKVLVLNLCFTPTYLPLLLLLLLLSQSVPVTPTELSSSGSP